MRGNGIERIASQIVRLSLSASLELLSCLAAPQNFRRSVNPALSGNVLQEAMSTLSLQAPRPAAHRESVSAALEPKQGDFGGMDEGQLPLQRRHPQA